MCFSTTASFTAGIVLTTMGVACVSKVQKRSQLMFATIPFIFAMQQFSEGFVWLWLLGHTSFLSQKTFETIFLSFAIVIWPTWVPVSMFLMEKNRFRQILLGMIAGVGIIFSIGGVFYLALWDYGARIINHHIHYDLNISMTLCVFAGTLYLIPTIVSHFMSSIKTLPYIGLFILSSHIVSRVIFKDNVLSVWCFFAAIISITIYVIVARRSLQWEMKGYKFN